MHLPQDLEGGPALPPSTQHQPSPGPAPSTGQEVIQAEIVVDVAPLSPREGGPRGGDGAGPPPAFGPPPLSSLARPLEPLSDAALQLLQSQGAAACDQDLRAMRHDDELALLSARRGLQVRFVVKALRTYMPLSEMVVEAPEFATVEYLKRRIFRAKLQRGEVRAEGQGGRGRCDYVGGASASLWPCWGVEARGLRGTPRGQHMGLGCMPCIDPRLALPHLAVPPCLPLRAEEACDGRQSRARHGQHPVAVQQR